MRILLHINERPVTSQAVDMAGRLAQAAAAEITLLAAAPTPGAEARLRAALERARRDLPVPTTTRLVAGREARVLLAEAQSGRYDMVVLGSRGQRGWQRLAFGSLASRLARYSPVPVLIVKGARRAGVARVLACSAGRPQGEQVVRWAGRLAAWLGAELAVLHVMSQLALSAEAPLGPLIKTAEEAMAEQTREGRQLTHELELARQAGVGPAVRVQARLRHGLVVDEVVDEVREGGHDLVVIGAHQAPDTSAGWGRLRAFLLEDVADQILTALERPVLVVKG